MIKGYIFDFNGTLFWDTQYHDMAWMLYAKNLGVEITSKFLREELHGKVNREIFRIILGKELPADEAAVKAEEKENIYREIVRNLDEEAKLAAGVENVFNTLKERNIPMAIATSSNRENVEFYKETFQLNRWFSDDRIIYDDGTFEGKPAPDIFLMAAECLDLKPSECVVVEDSITGIKSAQAAGIGHIFLITSGNHLAWDDSDPNVRIISDFVNFLK